MSQQMQKMEKRVAGATVLLRKAGQYDESKHLRHAKGSGRNAGQFAPKGGGNISAHPNFSKSDYEALRQKGYSGKEILGIWNKDRAMGQTKPLARKPIPNAVGLAQPPSHILSGNAKAWHDLASRNYEHGLKTGNYETGKRVLGYHKSALAAFQKTGDTAMVKQYAERVKKLQRRVNWLWDGVVNQKH